MKSPGEQPAPISFSGLLQEIRTLYYFPTNQKETAVVSSLVAFFQTQMSNGATFNSVFQLFVKFLLGREAGATETLERLKDKIKTKMNGVRLRKEPELPRIVHLRERFSTAAYIAGKSAPLRRK